MVKSCVLAYDIGGTSIRAAIVRDGRILRLKVCSTPKEKVSFLKKIDLFAEELISDDVRGIGVGIAGIIKKGVVKKSPNLPLKNFNIKNHFEKKFHKKTYVFNDAGCHSLAEFNYGFKKKDFFMITLGTGIGGGLVINGQSYRGSSGHGAELGHILVRGVYWESLWKKTRERIRKDFKKDILIKDLVRLNDSKSKKILEECADYLGEGIATLINVLDPKIVVLGGGPSESGKYFLDLIRKSVERYNFLEKKTPIFWTRLKHTGVLGASLLVI
jgi:glucokinase